MPANALRIGVISGFEKFGCTAITTIAQISWKISRPSEMRPAVVSSSKDSWKSFTTSSVEESASTIPM